MRLYFGAAVSLRKTKYLNHYQKIVKILEGFGHQVLSKQILDPTLKIGEGMEAKKLFAREVKKIKKSQAMIAEVSTPSWGTAFLMERALKLDKPVLALHFKDNGGHMASMIAGHPDFYVRSYNDDNLETILRKSLKFFCLKLKRQGKLVVIDGMDGSGKALQSKLLVDWLQKHGYGTKYIDFPRYYTSFHGQNVGRFLRGEFGTNLEVNPYLASVLYAMDRLTARDELIDWLKNKNIVVANRYTTSNFAFQSAKLPAGKRKKFIDWLYQMEYKEHGLPKEDVVLFLYVPLSVSQKLLEKKQGTKARRYIKKGKDIHEQDVEFQRQVLKMYLKLCRQFKHWEKIVCVDNKNKILPPDKIQKKIIQILKKRKII